MSELEAYVKYDYIGDDDGVLNIKSGEIVTVIEKDLGNGWCKARNKKSVEGFIPSNYIRILSSSDSPSFVGTDYYSEFSDDDDTANKEQAEINEDLEQISLSKFETSLRSKFRNFNMPKSFLKNGGEDFITGQGYASKQIEARIKMTIENCTEVCVWKPIAAISSCSIILCEKPSKLLNINACVKYKIKSSYSEYPISRRFRNFFWLFMQIKNKYPCIVIPALPPKQIAGRFENEFIEIRRQYLQKWLNHITKHPVLGSSPAVKLFLSADDEDIWKRGKDTIEKSRDKNGYFFNLVEAPPEKIDWKNKLRQIDNVTDFIDKLEKGGRALQINFEDFHKLQSENASKLLKKIGASTVTLSAALNLNPDNNQNDLTLLRGIQKIGDTYDEIGNILSKDGKVYGDFIENNFRELNGLTSKIKPLLTLSKCAAATFDSRNDVDIPPETLETVDRNLRVITRSVDAELNWLQKQREIHLKSTFVQCLKDQIELHTKITDILHETLSYF